MASKISKGCVGEISRVLVCANYVPTHPSRYKGKPQYGLVKVVIPAKEKEGLYAKQDGRCLCHGQRQDREGLTAVETRHVADYPA